MVNARQPSPLAEFGVSPRAERLYRQVLRDGQLSRADLAERLGWEATEVSTEMEQLLELGLLVARDDQVTTSSPHLAIGRLIAREAQALAERERHLDQLRLAIREYAAEDRAEHDDATVEQLERYAGRALARVVNSLLRSTSGPLMLVHPNEWFAEPGWLKDDTLLPLEVQGGRLTRSIYPTEVLHNPEGAALVDKFVEKGEVVRLMPSPPSRLMIFGREAVLVPTVWGQGQSGRIVLRTQGAVDGFAELFEMMWQVSTPYAGDAVSELEASQDVRGEVIRMLAMGAKDETIARQLGLSLRTVRRRVAELMAELGVSTRFQAGVEAMRRKLV